MRIVIAIALIYLAINILLIIMTRLYIITKTKYNKAIHLLSFLYYCISEQWTVNMENGVTHQGMDEGDVTGCQLLGEIREFLNKDEYVKDGELPF